MPRIIAEKRHIRISILVRAGVYFAMGVFIDKRLDKVAQGLKAPCPRNDVVAQAGGPLYAGPLYDTHIHAPLIVVPPKAMSFAFPAASEMAQLGGDVSMDDIVCLLDREGSRGALVFFTQSRFVKSQLIAAVKRTMMVYPDRIVPLIMPAPLPGLAPDFSPAKVAEIFDDNPGLLAGIGELAFYTDYFAGQSPDDRAWQQIYKMAGQQGPIVMLHPARGQEPALENVFAANPEVTFILHSNEVEHTLGALLAKFPNVYFTLDTSDFTTMFDDDTNSKEIFLAEADVLYDEFISRGLRWRQLMEQYPDRFMWGTDRAKVWHFDEAVSAKLEQVSREFIGQLSPEVQENYAYKNAERILAR